MQNHQTSLPLEELAERFESRLISQIGERYHRPDEGLFQDIMRCSEEIFCYGELAELEVTVDGSRVYCFSREEGHVIYPQQ